MNETGPPPTSVPAGPKRPVRFEFPCLGEPDGCTGVLALGGFYQDQLVIGVPWTCPLCDRFQLARLTDRECPPNRVCRIEFAPAETPAGVAFTPRTEREGSRRTRALLRNRR